MLVEAGHRPKDFLNWPETEREVALAGLAALNRKRGKAAKKGGTK